MRRFQPILRNPVVIAFAVAMTLAGCASKRGVPNSAAELGLNSATPGSQQDFTVNVGDREILLRDRKSTRLNSSHT